MSTEVSHDQCKGSACCPNPCTEVCPDVCREVCLSGTVQRGEFLVESSEESQVKAASFVITLTANNCTGEVINNFRPRLQFRLLNPNATDNNSSQVVSPQISGISADQVHAIVASIGCPNHQNDSSDPEPANPWNGNSSTALLSKGVHLPPGCANFKVYLFLSEADGNDYTNWVLLPPVFSVIGQIKCCFGECSSVHKSVHLDCECLPLELNQ